MTYTIETILHHTRKDRVLSTSFTFQHSFHLSVIHVVRRCAGLLLTYRNTNLPAGTQLPQLVLNIAHSHVSDDRQNGIRWIQETEGSSYWSGRVGVTLGWYVTRNRVSLLSFNDTGELARCGCDVHVHDKNEDNLSRMHHLLEEQRADLIQQDLLATGESFSVKILRQWK